MEDGLFYSESALLNRVLFYSDYNDINIFVEDEYKEYIYENIYFIFLRPIYSSYSL